MIFVLLFAVPVMAAISVYPPRVELYSQDAKQVITVTDRNAFDSTLLGLSLMEVLGRLYPKQINLEANLKLIGSPETIRRLAAGETAVQVRQSWAKTLDQFSEKRQRYLIYP